ncbi:NAD(P)H-hydrate epimerase [Nocardioides zeae]
MRAAHTEAQVRAAEEALVAGLPPGVLMQRAATGLAHAVLALLEGAYGRRVTLLVGGGNNGGDALLAGALLARRGAAVDAVLLTGSPHEAGLAALRAAGGRVRRGTDAPARCPTWSWTGSSGSADGRGCGRTRWRRSRPTRRRAPG